MGFTNYRRLSIAVALLAATTIACGCHGGVSKKAPLCEVEGVSRTTANELRLCGPIELTTLAEIQAELRPSDREVTISSYGGDANTAMQIGSLINSRRLTLKIDKICASACAHFLFLRTHNVIALPGAVIAFHNTFSYPVRSAMKNGIVVDEKYLKSMIDEWNLFEEEHIDRDSLFIPISMLQPVCVGILPKSRSDADNRIFLATKYSAYVPDRNTVVRWRGREFVGMWPVSARQAGESLNKYSPNPISVVFGHPNPNIPQTDTLPMPNCPENMGKH